MPEAEVAIIGPGAVGAYLASRLARSCRIRLIGRDPRWLRRIRASGLRVSSAATPRGRLFPASALHPTIKPSRGDYSAVFICVKARDTAGALKTARTLAGPRTAVINLQNGLGHRRPMLAAFGPARTVFGSCYIAGLRLDRTHVRHHGGNEIGLAANGRNQAALKAARRLLRAAGLRVSLAGDEERLLWTKAALNAAVNPLGALAAKPNGALASVPALREILRRAAREAEAAAKAAGHRPLYPRLDLRAVALCRKAPLQENSMLQDLRAGRLTEAGAILPPLLRSAKGKAPILGAMYRFVTRLERELRK